MKKLLMFLVATATALALQANPEGYVMVSMISPGQLPTAESNIYGGRLSVIYGDCQSLYGLDLGISGRIHERMNGAQFGLLFSLDDAEMNGFGLGCVNYVAGEFTGCQVGLWNHAEGGAGAQLGVVNTSTTFSGVQLGLLNFAKTFTGVQIGLSNYAGAQGVCKWLPLVNVGW